MTLPAFTATTKLAESAATQTIAVVRAFNALVTNLQQIFTTLLARVQLDSVLLQGIALVEGTNQIPHTLGRAWTGWVIIDTKNENLIYSAATQPNPTTYLTLIANNAGNLSLMVF